MVDLLERLGVAALLTFFVTGFLLLALLFIAAFGWLSLVPVGVFVAIFLFLHIGRRP